MGLYYLTLTDRKIEFPHPSEEARARILQGKKEYLAHLPSLPVGPLRAVAASGSPARHHRQRVACARSSPTGRPRPRPLFLPCEETEHLPARGDRSRR
ncbi:hypothetical protein GW17_00053610, partial [Ensete ventricosum]